MRKSSSAQSKRSDAGGASRYIIAVSDDEYTCVLGLLAFMSADTKARMGPPGGRSQMRSRRSAGEYSPSPTMRKGSESTLYDGSPWIAVSMVCSSESVGEPGCGGGGMGTWVPVRVPWRSVRGRSSSARCSVLSPLPPVSPQALSGGLR